MSIRFQADANLDPDIGIGLRRKEPSIDFRNAVGVIADGTSDPEVLRMSAEEDRVLVSHDVTTMPDHFDRFAGTNSSPGIILIPSNRPLGDIIESLLFIWIDWSEEEVLNQVRWLPRAPSA